MSYNIRGNERCDLSIGVAKRFQYLLRMLSRQWRGSCRPNFGSRKMEWGAYNLYRPTQRVRYVGDHASFRKVRVYHGLGHSAHDPVGCTVLTHAARELGEIVGSYPGAYHRCDEQTVSSEMRGIAKPLSGQGALFLLGYALWSLGVGSVLHAVLLEAKQGHACSYGLGGWPAAMVTALAFSVVGFPAVLLLARVAVRWADKGRFGVLALRMGIASLPLAGIGILSVVLVSADVLDHLDPLFLSSILVFPIYLGVLAWSWPATRDSLHTYRRIALVTFAIWAAISLGMGLFLYSDILRDSGWLVEGRAGRLFKGLGGCCTCSRHPCTSLG